MKEWQTQLKNANERLAPLGMRLTVNEDEEGFFALHVCGPAADEGFIYAQNYYEDELEGLISDAEAYARTKGQRSARPRPVSIGDAKALAETIYDITAIAEPTLASYIEDSRERFSLIWNWALSFQKAWGERDEEDPDDEKDYLGAVEAFTAEAVAKIIRNRQPEAFNIKLRDLEVTVRTYNAIVIGADIHTLGELCSFRRSEITRLRNVGKRCMSELEDILEKHHMQWDSAPKVPRLKHIYNR